MPLLDCKDRSIDDTLDELTKKDSNVDWVILGHVKSSYKIQVLEKGTGFKGLLGELETGLIQYIVYRVYVNDVYKAVFIAFCGDSVQGTLRGKFQTFVKDMEYFLKGRYHLVIQAKNEDDLDEEEIMKSLLRGLHNYDATLKPELKSQKTITVQSSKDSLQNSEKVVSKQEVKIDKQASDKFWSQNKPEEKIIQSTTESVKIETKTEEKKKTII